MEKSDTKGVDEVEEGNGEEFEGGNALVGVEEKPEKSPILFSLIVPTAL